MRCVWKGGGDNTADRAGWWVRDEGRGHSPRLSDLGHRKEASESSHEQEMEYKIPCRPKVITYNKQLTSILVHEKQQPRTIIGIGWKVDVVWMLRKCTQNETNKSSYETRAKESKWLKWIYLRHLRGLVVKRPASEKLNTIKNVTCPLFNNWCFSVF